MVFNSIFTLVHNDMEGVYKFFCKLFYESNVNLDIEDRIIIYAALKKIQDAESPNLDSFMEILGSRKKLVQVFSQLGAGGRFEYFTNEKQVYISTMDSGGLSLSLLYLNVFGYSNVRN